jgi:tRNA1(Val) A37 N6-methylase TrmN6
VPAKVQTTLLNGRVKLHQPEKGFRAGIDTVFVAAFADIKQGDKILDLGCGVGGAGLCLASRVPEIISLSGMEIDSNYAAMARTNYRDNDIKNGQVLENDIRALIPDYEQSFDYIVCNPPYMEEGDHQRAEDSSRARAMGQGEGEASLADWIKAFKFYLKHGGGFSLVQRADKLDVIIRTLGASFGAIEILPLFSRADNDCAKRILLRGRKGRKTPCRILPSLIVHESDGAYTKRVEDVLRKGYALPLNEREDA